MDQYRKAGYQAAKTEPSGTLKKLSKGAVDAYSLMLIRAYQDNYGLDSVKQERYFDLLDKKNDGPAYEKALEEARTAMFTKKLSTRDSTKLAMISNQKQNMNNEALFKGSLPYRRAIDVTLQRTLFEDYGAAPCKAEIPYLSKVEERLKDKNIHFVSISIDRMTDYDTWKSYVLDHKLKGIQLIADNNVESDFIKRFGITYIPRFLLIDPNGIIVDANARRPSDEKLSEQLAELL